jgi:hypothetical protein
MYTLPNNCQAFLAAKIPSELWHQRLGHPSLYVTLRILQENNIAVNSEISPSLICNACQLGKSHQLPFSVSTHVSTVPLEIVHTDVWGPALPSVNNSKYYVSFIDDYSRYVWVYFLRSKSDVEKIFLQFQKHAETMLNTKVKSVQSDWWGEYQCLHHYFQVNVITHRVSYPHTHQQNGLAERKHRHIVETGLALLAQAHLPLRFWDEAFNTATYLINRMPSKVIGHDTPIHKLFGTNPDYTKLCVFDCACWPNLCPYNPKKLNFRTKQCTFLGYSSAHKGYKCFDHTIGRIYISRDVVFDEQVFSFAKQRPDITQTPQNSHHPIILHVLTRDTQYSKNSLIQGLTEPVVDNVNMRVLQTGPDANKNVSCNSSPSGDVEPNSSSGPLPLISEEQMGSPGSAQPIIADDEVVPDAPQETVIQHPMRTRL